MRSPLDQRQKVSSRAPPLRCKAITRSKNRCVLSRCGSLQNAKRVFCVSACFFSPHCEPCSAKDCVIAFPANVCKSAWAGARAPSEARDWCPVTWEMTGAWREKAELERNRVLRRGVWPCVCVRALSRSRSPTLMGLNVCDGSSGAARSRFSFSNV